MEQTYITPFKYGVILEKPVEKPTEIMFEGTSRIIDSQTIRFTSLKQLTTIEVEEKFKGTLGIDKYFGEFKM